MRLALLLARGFVIGLFVAITAPHGWWQSSVAAALLILAFVVTDWFAALRQKRGVR